MRQLNPDNSFHDLIESGREQTRLEHLQDMVIACAEMYAQAHLEDEYNALVIVHSVRRAADRTGLDVDDDEILAMVHRHTEIE